MFIYIYIYLLYILINLKYFNVLAM